MRIKIILTVVVCYFELLLIAVRSKVMSYIDTHYAWWRKLMHAIQVRWWLLGVTIVLFYSIIVYYSRNGGTGTVSRIIGVSNNQ